MFTSTFNTCKLTIFLDAYLFPKPFKILISSSQVNGFPYFWSECPNALRNKRVHCICSHKRKIFCSSILATLHCFELYSLEPFKYFQFVTIHSPLTKWYYVIQFKSPFHMRFLLSIHLKYHVFPILRHGYVCAHFFFLNILWTFRIAIILSCTIFLVEWVWLESII